MVDEDVDLPFNELMNRTGLMNRFSSWIFALTITLFLSTAAQAQRQNISFNEDWKFKDAEASFDELPSDWQPVRVPHTWNVKGYRRGAGWYSKSFTPQAKWKDKRIFVFFEAVSLAADVYLNGQKLGRHEGGFTAFCFELTPHLKWGESNELRVRADNSKLGIAPDSADFNFNGGIYRPVHLVVASPICISPLNNGGPGVYLTSRNISAGSATIEVKTLLSNANNRSTEIQLETEIFDAKGKRVARLTTSPEVKIGQGSLTQTLKVSKPHLWKGKPDPYLYEVRVHLRGKGIQDDVTQPLGIRTVGFSADERFLLNGQPYALHGVNRHQDWKGKAWELTEADQAADIALINELGATTVRLAHYPQSHLFLEGADRTGLILWEEIPTVNRIHDTPLFEENAKQQLREMITQGYNHPSIAMWGLFNEVKAPNNSSPDLQVVEYSALAHELDSTRPTVGASDSPQLENLNRAPDHIGFNIYPGWYVGQPEDYNSIIEQRSQSVGGRRIALSEYGGGAAVTQFIEGKPGKTTHKSRFHPEGNQTYLHQQAWKAIKDNPKIWGSYVWVMFDFAVNGRNEGDRPGINDKGLVTDDRAIKKDSFYFYKANWNPEPMVYISNRRANPRKQASTEIEVFSNGPSVELLINGRSIGMMAPNDIHVAHWDDVTLVPGTNSIEARTVINGQTLVDKCTWVLEATA